LLALRWFCVLPAVSRTCRSVDQQRAETGTASVAVYGHLGVIQRKGSGERFGGNRSEVIEGGGPTIVLFNAAWVMP
jgi:hypothetical protein